MSINPNGLICVQDSKENQQWASAAHSSHDNSLIPVPPSRAEIPLTVANEWLQTLPRRSEQNAAYPLSLSNSASFLQRQFNKVTLKQQHQTGPSAELTKQLDWQEAREKTYKKPSAGIEGWRQKLLEKIMMDHSPLLSDFEKDLNILEEELPAYLEALQDKYIYFPKAELKTYQLDPKKFEKLSNCLQKCLLIQGRFAGYAGVHVLGPTELLLPEEHRPKSLLYVLPERALHERHNLAPQGAYHYFDYHRNQWKTLKTNLISNLTDERLEKGHLVEGKWTAEEPMAQKWLSELGFYPSSQAEHDHLNTLQTLFQRAEKVVQQIKKIEATQHSNLQKRQGYLMAIRPMLQQEPSLELFETIHENLTLHLSHAPAIQKHLETCIDKKESDFIDHIRDGWMTNWKMLDQCIGLLRHWYDPYDIRHLGLESEEAQPQLAFLSDLFKKWSLLSEQKTVIDGLDKSLRQFEQQGPQDEESIKARQIARQHLRAEKAASEEAEFLKSHALEEQEDNEKITAAQQKVQVLEEQQRGLLNSIQETEEHLQKITTAHEAAVSKMKEAKSLSLTFMYDADLPSTERGSTSSEACRAADEFNSLKIQQKWQLQQKKDQELRLQLSQELETLKELEAKTQAAQKACSEIQKTAAQNILKRQQQQHCREMEQKQVQAKNQLASYQLYLQSGLSSQSVLNQIKDQIWDEINLSKQQLIQCAHSSANPNFNHFITVSNLSVQKEDSFELLDAFLKQMSQAHRCGCNLFKELIASDDSISKEMVEKIQEEQQTLDKALEETRAALAAFSPLVSDFKALNTHYTAELKHHLESDNLHLENQLLKNEALRFGLFLTTLEGAFKEANLTNKSLLTSLSEKAKDGYCHYKHHVERYTSFCAGCPSTDQHREEASHADRQAIQAHRGAITGSGNDPSGGPSPKLSLKQKLEDLERNYPGLAFYYMVKEKKAELKSFEELLNDFRKSDGRWTRLLGQIHEALNQSPPVPAQQRSVSTQQDKSTEGHSAFIRAGRSERIASDRRNGSNFYDAALSGALKAQVTGICQEITRQQEEEEVALKLQFEQEMLVLKTQFSKAQAERSAKLLQALEALKNHSESHHSPTALAQWELPMLSKLRQKKMALPQCTQIQCYGNGNLPKPWFRSVETVYLKKDEDEDPAVMVAYYSECESGTWKKAQFSLEQFNAFLKQQGLELNEGSILNEVETLEKILSLFGLSRLDSGEVQLNKITAVTQHDCKRRSLSHEF